MDDKTACILQHNISMAIELYSDSFGPQIKHIRAYGMAGKVLEDVVGPVIEKRDDALKAIKLASFDADEALEDETRDRQLILEKLLEAIDQATEGL